MSKVNCPHCKYEFSDEDIWHTGSTDFPSETDGDTTNTNCLSCKNPLTIELSLSPEWKFLGEDGDEI
jgi:hypothetical protein